MTVLARRRVSALPNRGRERGQHTLLLRAIPRALPRERPPISAEAIDAVREVLESRDVLGDDVHGGLLLGDAIVTMRLRLLLSQDQVILRSGVPRRRIRDIESGDDATAEELIAIGVALDVSPAGLAALPSGRTLETTRIAAEWRGTPLLPGFPGAPSWEILPWREDVAAQAFVAEHGDEATIEQIAEAMGVSTRMVERDIVEGLRKLRRALEDEHERE